MGGLGAVALAGSLGLAACGRRPGFKSIDLTGSKWGRDFSLSAPDGGLRTLADFKDKVVLLFFGFTYCPDVCPTALARAVEVRKQLGAAADRVQVIFVTIDPERDSAELLKAYTQAFDPSFLGLRGSAEQTKRAASEFKVVYEKVVTGASYTMNHSTTTYVFDTRGRLRLAVQHAQPAADIVSDLRILLGEDR